MQAPTFQTSLPAHKRREKVKTSIKDYIEELEQENAAAEAVATAAGSASNAVKAQERSIALTPRFARTLTKQQILPLIDLVYSDSQEVQRYAVSLLGTLALNSDNIDILVDSGSLKPLLTMAGSSDPAVRRSALSGLAHMTAREDIRTKLCAVPNGLKQCIEGTLCPEIQSRLAAIECVANVAESYKLRGLLVRAGAIPALNSLLVSRVAELKRMGMVALQRLAVCAQLHGRPIESKDDPEGDGFAAEMVADGVLTPLLVLLKTDKAALLDDDTRDLRTHAMQTIFFIAGANEELKLQLGSDAPLLKLVVALLLLEEHLGGGPSQREACRTVQLLSAADPNLQPLIGAGLIGALSILARSDMLAKKQFAATMMLRLSSVAECRGPLLSAGGARSLCFLSRSSLPRKIVKPAAAAITMMSSFEECVPPLLDAGAGAVLSALAASSDPELRLEGCKALADMLECTAVGDSSIKVVDQMLQQGALASFLAAASVPDKQAQLEASRGLMLLSQRSPLYARIVAKKGACRGLSVLVLGRDAMLTNALTAISKIAAALALQIKEPLTNRRLARVRSVLEVGVVGSPREFWARLNEDSGMPAAQIMRLARLQDATGQMAREILRHLKPGLLESLEIDMPEKTGWSPEAIADRQQRHLCIQKIQRRYRDVLEQNKSGKDNSLLSFLSRPTAASVGSSITGVLSAAMRASKAEHASGAGVAAGSTATREPVAPSPRLTALLRNANRSDRFAKELVGGLTPKPPPGSARGSAARPATARAKLITVPVPEEAQRPVPAAGPAVVMRVARQAQMELPPEDLTMTDR